MRRPIASALLCFALVVASCGGDDDQNGLEPLDTPTFSDEPADTVPDDSADSSEIEAGVTATDPTTTLTTRGGGATTSSTPSKPTIPVERVSFDDPIGDATPGIGRSTPPGWSDLAGAALERQGNAYRLEIRLGDTAPRRAPGPETMNVASFYDVDGDGSVDFEIWVNLGPDGWGPVWYDDQGNAAPGPDSNVSIEVTGNTVALLFPDVMLEVPDGLRFSLASEYGELATIGSSFARRDDAPDDDRAVPFP